MSGVKCFYGPWRFHVFFWFKRAFGWWNGDRLAPGKYGSTLVNCGFQPLSYYPWKMQSCLLNISWDRWLFVPSMDWLIDCRYIHLFPGRLIDWFGWLIVVTFICSLVDWLIDWFGCRCCIELLFCSFISGTAPKLCVVAMEKADWACEFSWKSSSLCPSRCCCCSSAGLLDMFTHRLQLSRPFIQPLSRSRTFFPGLFWKIKCCSSRSVTFVQRISRDSACDYSGVLIDWLILVRSSVPR